jgi:PAS domain S-box-containing protein
MNTASRFPAERLHQVLDGAVDTGIIMLDVDGTITGCRNGAEALLGWSQDEMLGKTLVAIFPPEGGAALLKAVLTDARTKGKEAAKDGGCRRAVAASGPSTRLSSRNAWTTKVFRSAARLTSRLSVVTFTCTDMSSKSDALPS